TMAKMNFCWEWADLLSIRIVGHASIAGTAHVGTVCRKVCRRFRGSVAWQLLILMEMGGKKSLPPQCIQAWYRCTGSNMTAPGLSARASQFRTQARVSR